MWLSKIFNFSSFLFLCVFERHMTLFGHGSMSSDDIMVCTSDHNFTVSCMDIFYPPIYANFFSYVVIFPSSHLAFTVSNHGIKSLSGVILCSVVVRLSAVNEYCAWWKWRYEVCMISHAVRTEERFKMPRLYFSPHILRHWLMQKCIE